MNIDLKKLKAARRLTAGKDIRYYLNGVCIRKDALLATNGHYLIKASVAVSPATDQDIIVPNDVLDRLFKKMKAHKGVDEVSLHKFATDGSFSFRVGDQVLEVFKPVDGSFPDIERVIPDGSGKETPGNYNWSYLQIFDKALADLGVGGNVILRQFGPMEAALVHFGAREDVIGVIMPIKHL